MLQVVSLKTNLCTLCVKDSKCGGYENPHSHVSSSFVLPCFDPKCNHCNSWVECQNCIYYEESLHQCMYPDGNGDFLRIVREPTFHCSDAKLRSEKDDVVE